MTIKLNLKSGAVLVTVLLLMLAGVAYGVNVISRGVAGFVSVNAEISVDEAIGLYHVAADGQPGAPITSADFGTVSLDPFGNATPTDVLTVWAENGTGTAFKLTIDDESTGDGGIDTFQIGEVVYGPNGQPLSTTPDPDIVLAPGQLMLIDLSLEFTDVVIGDHTLTVRFEVEGIGLPAPTPDGLVGWWPGDGDAMDITANANHGTITGDGTYVPGMVDQAFSFNGAGFVEIPHDPSLNLNQFTFELWVNPAVDAGWQALVAKGGGPYAASLWLVNDKVEVWFDPDGYPAVRSSTGLTIGQWYHIAGTFDGVEAKIYIDGSLDATALIEVVPATTTVPLFFGQRGDGGTPYFGLLDEVSIYNRALTAEEVSAIYAAGSLGKTRPEPPPQVEWIVDNEDPEFSVEGAGWVQVNNANAVNGTFHFHDPGNSGERAIFTFDLPVAGTYALTAHWVAGANRATDATYWIEHSSGTVGSVKDQTVDGGQFNPLGVFHFRAGNARVYLDAAADGLVIADAVRFILFVADP